MATNGKIKRANCENCEIHTQVNLNSNPEEESQIQSGITQIRIENESKFLEVCQTIQPVESSQVPLWLFEISEGALQIEDLFPPK